MTSHAVRLLQLSALLPLGLVLVAIACLRIHQTSNQDWALWTAFIAVACGTLGAGYLIGHAIPAQVSIRK